MTTKIIEQYINHNGSWVPYEPMVNQNGIFNPPENLWVKYNGEYINNTWALNLTVKGRTKKNFKFRPKIGDFVYGDKTWSTILDKSKTCVGVITDVRSRDFDFVALTSPVAYASWSTTYTVIEDIVTTNDGQISVLDFKGKSNTEKIISQLGVDNVEAAKRCFQYSTEGFPAGSWYLPAEGQLKVTHNNFDKIQTSIETAGGQGFLNKYYFSSTQVNANYAWVFEAYPSGSTYFRTLIKSDNGACMPFCTYEYNSVPNGVYIYDKDGDYFTKEQWTTQSKSSSDAMGIGVVTDESQFVISPEHYYGLAYSTSSGLISNITTIEGKEPNAKTDYQGYNSTQKMIEQLGIDNVPAAKYCNNYIFKNGQNGYLPGLGEWYTTSNYKDEINDLISIIGGTAIADAYHRVSTQYKTDYSWKYYYKTGSATYEPNNSISSIYTRAFTMLPYKEEIKGVRILDTDNKLYTKENWINMFSKVYTEGTVTINISSSLNIAKEHIIITPSIEGAESGSTSATVTLNMEIDSNISSLVGNSLNVSVNGELDTISISNNIAIWTKVLNLATGSSTFAIEIYPTNNYSDKDILGIAIIDSRKPILMSHNIVRKAINDGNKVPENMTEVGSEEEALGNFDGYENSLKIVEAFEQIGTTHAAGYCLNYKFPYDGLKGYLPSIGDLDIIYSNRTEVNEILEFLGTGVQLTTGSVISSLYGGYFSGFYRFWQYNFLEPRTIAPSNQNANGWVIPITNFYNYEEFPLEGASLTIDKNISNAKLTDISGNVSTLARAYKNHIYYVEYSGFSPYTENIEVFNQNINKEIFLERGHRVNLTIKENTDDGNTISGVNVKIISSDGTFNFTKQSTEGGLVSVNLLSGYYTIEVSKDGYDTTILQLSVEDSEVALTVVLTKNYNLSATITRAGQPVSEANVSIYDNQEGVISAILSQMGRVLFKRTGDKAGTFIRLGENNTEEYFDGSTALLDGSEGDVMVYLPRLFYHYESLGGTKFAYKYSLVKEADDWIEIPASLVGAYKGYTEYGKLYSISGESPQTITSWTNFNTYASERGTGYQIIDYGQHCHIAMLFYAKYKNRNSQAILGTGSANRLTKTGGTNNMGNNDTQNVTSGWVNFQGIEGVFGGIYEFIKGVEINNYVWTITDPDGSTRNVNAGTTDGWITSVAAENGPFFDMVPTKVGGSSTTYYSDYYSAGSSGPYILARSYRDAEANCGIAYIAYYVASSSAAGIGSRLAFRGELTESKDVASYKSITAV